jgi:hypothetical protein
MSDSPPSGQDEQIPLAQPAKPQQPARPPMIRHIGKDTPPADALETDEAGLIRAIGSSSAIEAAKKRDALEATLKRPMNLTGTGATRVRTFTSNLTEASIGHMDEVINRWLDASKAEVKFCSTTVGNFEGKHAEPKLIVTLWY